MQAQSKKDIVSWGRKGTSNYIFSPQLKSVTIYDEYVKISGNNSYVRASASDNASTKYNPQRFTVIVGVDSLYGLDAEFYDLEENTTYTYYQSLLQLNIDNSVTYKKTAESTFTTPVGFNTAGTYTSDGYRLYFNDGSRIILTQEE